MIIVRFTSGLGNQMLQYNFCRLMQETYPGVEVKADTTWLYRNDPHHGYELETVFPYMEKDGVAISKATFGECYKASGMLMGMFTGHFMAQKWAVVGDFVNAKILCSKNSDKIASQLIDDSVGTISEQVVIDSDGEKVNALYEMVMNLDVSRDYYIISYYAPEFYYRNRVDKLARELRFSEPEDENNRTYLEAIDKSNSVSIHVRRGDYLLPENRDRFCILGEEYYSKAIGYIRERIDNPHFFVFSDDLEAASELFKNIENVTYVSGNTGKESYRDIQLMSRCKRNIIANSTFSQWGAILNKNPEKIVVYPNVYMNGEDTDERKLEGWVRI